MDEVDTTKIKLNSISVFNVFLFCISPLLALPSIILGVYKRNKVSLWLLLIFASLITFQLVPSETKDLYQHYRFYNHSLTMSFSDFINVLSEKPDFVLYIAIFIFAKIGLNPQILFSLLTFITLYNFYSVYEKIVKKNIITNGYYFLGIITIFMSFEFLGLYSGIRNLLAASIAVSAFYLGHFDNKKGKGFFLFILAGLTHYGILLFLPVYIFGIMRPISKKLGLWIYLISFLFMFLSKKMLYNLAIALPLPESFDFKIKAYLLGLDTLEIGFLKSKAAYISYLIRTSWIYFAHLYIIITPKRESSFRFIIILLMCLLNFFSMTTDIQLRATYFVQPMFIFLLFYESDYKENKLLITLFSMFLLPGFIVNFIVNRNYFIESLFNFEFVTLLGTLLKKVTLEFSW